MGKNFKFNLKNTNGNARVGVINTPRGDIHTPAFMPVGTAGTVKAMYTDQVAELGAEVVLGNTYHLMLRPGAERIERLGGLHKFMQWDKPILTDSGGFQVMSLSKLRKMTEQGVEFQSHIDGRKYNLTPERSIEIQCLLGSDIQMQLDECTPHPATEKQAADSLRMSLRWADRSKVQFGDRPDQALFGIMQGSVYQDLREESAKGLVDMDFDGYSIGGLAVGEGQEIMLKVLDYAADLLPKDKPRYLMGVGTPSDLIESVRRGVDMFDCVMPTRAGRHGLCFTHRGKVNLKNARHADDPRPLDEDSPCEASSRYSRAYLHHLMKCNEYLAAMLLTWHNLAYYQELMAGIRLAILEGRFEQHYIETTALWAQGDIEPV